MLAWFRRFILTIAAVSAFASGASAQVLPFAPGAGTEGRHWLPERPVAAVSGARNVVTLRDDVKIPMRDGVSLDARLFLPTLAAGAAPTPCVLMSDGYGRESAVGIGGDPPLYDIAAHGYAVIHLSLRGSGASGGKAGLFEKFGQDGYDAVEWMARQPWCSGRVGMVGASLLGISQWLTAKAAPPSLKAIVPQVACGDCYTTLWYPGGMLPGPGRASRPGEEVAEARAHREFDVWWRERSVLAEDAAAIAARGVAAFIAGGLDDYITPGNMLLFQQFKASDAHKRLFIGPHAHGWHVELIQDFQIQWLDHFLKGVANGVESAPQVVLFIKGANRWRTESDWPLPDERRATLHLSPRRSGSSGSRNDGSLGAATKVPQSVSQPFTPKEGPFLPVLLSSAEGRSADDQRGAESKVLTWTSKPLAAPTEVTGYPRLSFWASADAADADLVVSLNDVAPNGVSRQVVQGYLNAQHVEPLSAPTPLKPGEVRAYALQLMPTAYVFQRGHRIRLALAGGANAPSGLPGPQGPGPAQTPFTWTIISDPAHPARLDLPLIGSSSLPF